MTPLMIQMMLHYYAIAEPYALRHPQHANSPAVKKQRNVLHLQYGLIYPNETSDSGWSLTDNGRDYINRLLLVPAITNQQNQP